MTTQNQTTPESVLARNHDKIIKLQEYVSAHMIDRPYHNYKHALDATAAYQSIGHSEKLTSEQLFIGSSAMIAHDLISMPGNKYNEEQTIEEVRRLAPRFGYNSYEVSEMSKIIYATKVGVEPSSLLEMIAKDADLDNLGRREFFERSEALRQEFGVKNRLAWWQDSLNFLMQHRYYSETAKSLRNDGLNLNKFLLNNIIEATLDMVPAKSEELFGEVK